MMQFSQTAQRGQALLLVILTMVITLTVGLSIASRNITNSRSSSEEESSQKALSAAEAGIEKIAVDTSGTTDTTLQFSNNSAVKVQKTDLDQARQATDGSDAAVARVVVVRAGAGAGARARGEGAAVRTGYRRDQRRAEGRGNREDRRGDSRSVVRNCGGA